MSYLLKNLSWVTGIEKITADVRLQNNVIQEIGQELKPVKREQTIHFDNHFLYPGLINSHDHLEMNLYPHLGQPPYKNYVDWGQDIYKPRESPLREIEKVDIKDRLLWGGLKNLISGVTTVAHHNPPKKILFNNDYPVKVLSNTGWSHSLVFGKNVKEDFLKSKDRPFVLHAAEGVDSNAYGEIEKLETLGVLAANTVLVHAIALSQRDIDLIAARKCSVIWCPASNAFLFQKTADLVKLKKKVRIALGSDSTLTGSPTLLDEMRCALETGLATAKEIYEMVTVSPAGIFNFSNPAIAVGSVADLMISPAVHNDYFENLMYTGPADVALVFNNGNPAYANEKIAEPLKLKYSFKVNGTMKKARIDVATLRKKLKKQVGDKILEGNPLWKMIEC